MTTATRLFVVVLFVAGVCSATAEDQAPTVATNGSATDNDDDENNSNLKLELVSSSTSSITIRWTVLNVSSSADTGSSDSGSAMAATTFLVRATSMSTKMTLTSPPIDVNTTITTFTLPELAVDSAYRVCVIRSPEESTCDMMRTIPTVRLDSVLVLLVTIAFIILLILIAVVCWRCAIFCASRTDASLQEPSDEDEKAAAAAPTGAPGEDNVGDEKAPLLVTGGETPGQSPNSDQQEPASLYLYMTGPAVDYKQ